MEAIIPRWCLLLSLSAPVALAAPQRPEVDVRAEFVRLHAAADAAGVRSLWLAHPDAILVTIDEDLEGGLAAWEAAPEAEDSSATDEAFARALWGAELASAATGRSIYLDYASSFVGWDADQRGSFRQGQAAFGRARQAMQAGDLPAALEGARECSARALPLGDWWGTAMGLALEASALLRLDDAEGSLVAASRARLMYDQLGLVGAERAACETLIEALAELGRWPRALATLDEAAALAAAADDDEAVSRLLARRVQLLAARDADER